MHAQLALPLEVPPTRVVPTKPSVYRSLMAAPLNPTGPTCIDLFAGCGGLSLGLELAGFKPILVSELNKDALKTYLANRSNHMLHSCPDVYELTNEALDGLAKTWTEAGMAEVDLVCGGPPCQGYSGIGHRRTFSLEREQIPSNHLYKEMIRVIQQVRPKIFLFENVRGLLTGRWTSSGEKGEIWRDVKSSFDSIEGYSTAFELVQAKDYGVPQNRPRVILIGIRNDVRKNAEQANSSFKFFPEKTYGAPDPIDTIGDLVDPNYMEQLVTQVYPSDPSSPFQVRMRTIKGVTAGAGCPLTEQVYSKHSPNITNKFRYMLDNGGVIPDEMQTKKFAQRVLPAKWPDTGPNITATSLPDDYVHFSQPRTLTVREWARLQTFPDWYQFEGPRTTGGRRRAGDPDAGIWDRDVPKYTQIGNAVPVLLAEAIGKHLLKLVTVS